MATGKRQSIPDKIREARSMLRGWNSCGDIAKLIGCYSDEVSRSLQTMKHKGESESRRVPGSSASYEWRILDSDRDARLRWRGLTMPFLRPQGYKLVDELREARGGEHGQQ